MKAMSIVLFVLLLASLSQAQQRWERTYGGTDYDGGSSVQQTSDGGYIVAGTTRSFGNDWQVYLIKTNASGDTLWTKQYGEMWGDRGMSVQQTTDGGYIILGSRPNDFYLIKTNSTGDTLWTRPYGWEDWAEGRSVRQTSEGGYIIAGSTYSNSSQFSDQFFVVKTNASGDTLWTRSYGGWEPDRGHSAQQTFDGGYIAAGMVWSYGNGQQVYLIRFDAFGDTLWTRTYGGANWEWGHSVQQTSDTGFIIAAGTSSFGNYCQVYLVKTNASGDTLWTRAYGGAGFDEGWSVQQTTDGGYIVAGYTTSFGDSTQVYLVKTNAFGDTLWTRTFGGMVEDWSYSIQQTSDGGYILVGATTSFGNGYQVYLIKTDANGNVGTERGQGFEGSRVQGFKITPNPFITCATVPGHTSERFSLYDIAGRRVGTYRGDRVGEGLAPGIYFLKPEQGSLKPLRIVKLR